jgi:long-subunit acyl-CoA synthetase (AMP-forming)
MYIYVIKVVDLETGRNVGPNQRGELCFKGPPIMREYHGDLQATSASLDADGFFHTGDVGYYDEDGFFYIVDRVKELIKYKGYQVRSLSFILRHIYLMRLDQVFYSCTFMIIHQYSTCYKCN